MVVKPDPKSFSGKLLGAFHTSQVAPAKVFVAEASLVFGEKVNNIWCASWTIEALAMAICYPT